MPDSEIQTSAPVTESTEPTASESAPTDSPGATTPGVANGATRTDAAVKATNPENPVPHHRVRAMLDKQRKDYESRIAEYEKRIAEYERQIGEGRDDRPDYADASAQSGADAADWDLYLQRLAQRQQPDVAGQLDALRSEFAQQLQMLERRHNFDVRWVGIEHEHKAIMSMPGAREALYAAALHAHSEGSDPSRAVAQVARQFERQRMLLDAARGPRSSNGPGLMVPSGGGGGAPPKTQGEQRKSVRERIYDGLTGGEY